jgi:hypothetical protein
MLTPKRVERVRTRERHDVTTQPAALRRVAFPDPFAMYPECYMPNRLVSTTDSGGHVLRVERPWQSIYKKRPALKGDPSLEVLTPTRHLSCDNLCNVSLECCLM